MDYIKEAGMLAGEQCECCDFHVERTDPVYYEFDGDDIRVSVRVRHKHCHEFGQRERAAGKAEAYEDAAKFWTYTPQDDAVLACQVRAENARRKAMQPVRHSGADVMAMLLSKEQAS